MVESKPRVCFEVERVIGVSSDGNYQVQWAPAWVSRLHLVGCEHLIQEFLQRQTEKENTHVETHSETLGDQSVFGDGEHASVLARNSFASHSYDISTNEDYTENSKDVFPSFVNDSSSTPTDTHSVSQAVPNPNTRSQVTTSEWRKDITQEAILREKQGLRRIPFKRLRTKTTPVLPLPDVKNWNESYDNHFTNSNIRVKTEEEETADWGYRISPTDQYSSLNEANEYTNHDPMTEDEEDTFSHKPSIHNKMNTAKSFDNHMMTPPSHEQQIADSIKNNTNKLFPTGTIETEEQQHPCHACNKTFARKHNLDKHFCAPTTDGKPHACSQCHAKFSSSKDLRRHLRMHTGEKPYHCEICGRSFTRKDNLNTHKRVHMAYTCDWCGESFTRENTLKQHRPACPLKTISFIQMP